MLYATLEVEERLQGLGSTVFCNVLYVGNDRVLDSASRGAFAAAGQSCIL